jgi:CheY-like chemotaxis protein
VKNDRTKERLPVEDNLTDLDLSRAALTKLHLPCEAVVVRDGTEALEYLRLRGQSGPRATGNPAVILPTIRMPENEGVEVLRETKSSERLKSLPVDMRPSSARESDLIKRCQRGADACVVKPRNYREFINAIRQVGAIRAGVNEHEPKKRVWRSEAGSLTPGRTDL